MKYITYCEIDHLNGKRIEILKSLHPKQEKRLLNSAMEFKTTLENQNKNFAVECKN